MANLRVSSGIKKLDSTIEGGYKKGSINLVEGGAGTGKSIFAMQFLVKGIEDGENGVYMTFEEEEDNLRENMEKFGWNLPELEKQDKLDIISMNPEEIIKTVEKKSLSLKFTIIKQVKARRMVIDSLSAYSLMFEEGKERREALRHLFKTLREFGCTSLLIAERDINVNDNSSNTDLAEFEVDSVVVLYNIRKGDVRERALEVKKIRGTKNLLKLFPMQVTEKGIDIYPDQTLF